MTVNTNGPAEATTPETETPAAQAPGSAGPAVQGTLEAPGMAALERERETRRKAVEERDSLAKRLQEIEDREKSESQKAIERAERAEKALAAKSAEAERLAVIARHSIPEKYAALVTGTGEDLEKSAVMVAELVKTDTPGTPPAPPVSGIEGIPAAPSAVTLDERIAAATAAGETAMVAQLKAQKLANS